MPLHKQLLDPSDNCSKSPKTQRQTLSGIKVGENLLAQSCRREFEPATFVEKVGDLYTVEFIDGQRTSLDGTKLRLLSQPRKSSEILYVDESITSTDIIDFQVSIPEIPYSEDIDQGLTVENNKGKPDEGAMPNNAYLREEPVNCSTIKQNGFDCEISKVQNYDIKNLPIQCIESTDIDCPCALTENYISETVKCSKCVKHQHIFCLGGIEDPFLCYRCLKQHFCFDDVLFYNYYMNQNGMFPDKKLNAMCSLTPHKASLYRRVNRLCQSYSLNITHEEINDLIEEARELFNLVE